MSMVIGSLAWRLPIKIMTHFLNLEPTRVAAQRSPRRRPLHTCGTSLVGIAQKTCTKLKDLDGPLGSTAIRAISFMNSIFPFVYSLMYPVFPLLSFIDDNILTFETKAEAIFPPSTILFDKVDVLICSTETLPEHVDHILTELPSIIHRVPFLDWAIAYLISWLNFIISILTAFGSKNAREKEIPIDVNSNENARIMDLEEFVKSYSSQDWCNSAARGNNAHSEFDSSKDMTCEAIQKSVDRLRFLRNRIKVLEEPPFVDSPMYASYQSANSSPVSDCSEGEISSFNHEGKSDANCSYKEVLKKGHKEANHEGDAEAHETVEMNTNGEGQP